MSSVPVTALIRNKKRKRVWSRGIWQGIEVKKSFGCAPEKDPENAYFYWQVYWYKFESSWPGDTSGFKTRDCWTCFKCAWPLAGTGPNQRIGDKINLKGIRLKGFIEVQDCLVTPVNLKLAIFQTTHDSGSMSESFWKYCYRYARDIPATSAIGTIENMRWNYYTMVRTDDVSGNFDEAKINIVYKTTLLPCGHTANGIDTPIPSTNTATTNAGWIQRQSRPLSHGVGYNIPLDIVIDFNSTFDVEEDSIHYCWFCDYPYQSDGEVRVTDLYPTPAFANATSYGFKIYYSDTLYYTDP